MMKKRLFKKANQQLKKKLAEFNIKAVEGLFDPDNLPAFDEWGVLVGSEELLKKLDAELFSYEAEECI